MRGVISTEGDRGFEERCRRLKLRETLEVHNRCHSTCQNIYYRFRPFASIDYSQAAAGRHDDGIEIGCG